MANGEKQHIETVRKPYYDAQAGLWELSEALEATKDVELIMALEVVRNALFEFEMKLSEKYIWSE
jgi:hypothetical protein